MAAGRTSARIAEVPTFIGQLQTEDNRDDAWGRGEAVPEWDALAGRVVALRASASVPSVVTASPMSAVFPVRKSGVPNAAANWCAKVHITTRKF